MPGTFLVGGLVGITPQPGWKIQGAGIDNTVLRFQTNNPHTGAWMALISGNVDGVEISDLTLDCNLQNQGSSACAPQAIQIGGDKLRVCRVKSINWGSTDPATECFVLGLWGYSGGSTNCVIQDCFVTQPAPVAQSGGTTAIANFAGGISVIRDCTVAEVTAGTGQNGSPGYFNAYSGNVVSHNQARNLTGASNGFYLDTGNQTNLVVRDNHFDNVTSCIDLGLSSYVVMGLAIQNNTLRPAEGGTGICYTGATNGLATNVVISGNVIYPSLTATNITALSMRGRIFVSVVNNVLQGGGSGLDLYIPWTQTTYHLQPGLVSVNNFEANVNLAGVELSIGDSSWWRPSKQDVIQFTPNANGWWRVLSTYGWIDIAAEIQTGDWNNNTTEDVEFWTRANTYSTTSFGEMVETRRGTYEYPAVGGVPSARVVSDWPNSTALYLDIYVPNATNAAPIRVTSSGPYRTALQAVPALAPAAPAVYIQLNF
jgi:hypothetical protein